MKDEQSNTETTETMTINHVTELVGGTLILISSVYAIVLICRRKETRLNSYLLSMILLSIVYGTCNLVLALHAYQDGTLLQELQHEVILILDRTIFLMCHWIF